MRVKILKTGINGEGIAYIDKKPVFVENALVEEEVEIKITEKNQTYSKANAIRIVKKSKDRVRPSCRYESKCGACSLMCAKYEAQLEYKYEILKQSLGKYANIEAEKIQKVVASPSSFMYRNALKLPIIEHKGKLTTALYAKGSNHPIQVENCLIHEEALENMKHKILNVINKYHIKAFDHKTKKGLRTLILRGFNGQYQCTFISGNDTYSASFIDELMQIDGLLSLWQSINTSKKSVDPFGKVMHHLGGTRMLDFSLNNIKLKLSPKSFFQLNTKQADNLYRYVSELVDANSRFVVEAYSGIGAISLYIKEKAKEIVGIEYISDAVSNANRNAKMNNADHVKFVCGDAAEKLTGYSKKREIDCLIVDPPRSGLDDNMLACILKSKVKKIIYISCNPATLGKNLEVLSKKYKVESIQPFDMFPNTAHVESVCLLVRK